MVVLHSVRDLILIKSILVPAIYCLGFDPNDLKFTEEERLMYQRLWDSRGWDVSQDPTVIAAGRKYIFDVILGDPAKPVGHVFHRVVAVVTQTQDFLYKKHKDKITGLEGDWNEVMQPLS